LATDDDGAIVVVVVVAGVIIGDDAGEVRRGEEGTEREGRNPITAVKCRGERGGIKLLINGVILLSSA